MALTAISSAARILDQLLQHQHFNVENREEVKSLFNEVTSLHDTLENSNKSHKNGERIASLESQMVKAANKARDLTEAHIGEHVIRRNNLILSSYQLLEEANREIDVIVQGQRLEKIYVGVPIIDSPPEFDIFDPEIVRVYQRFYWKGEMVFIVGVAGIGKTTLAKRVFNSTLPGSKLATCHRYLKNNEIQLRAWVDESKSCYCDLKQILVDLVHSLGNCPEPEEMHEKTTQQLEQYLCSRLEHTRYLIVLDDSRNMQVFDYLLKILPNDGDTKMHILVTTRLENLAVSAKSSDIHIHRMTIRDQHRRCQTVIGNNGIDAEFLLKKLSLLHGIVLENSLGKSTKERESLENQIIYVETRVKEARTETCLTEYNLTFSPECLAEVKGEINLVKKMITKIEEAQDPHCLPGADSSIPAARVIVGDFKEIKDKLFKESSKLEIVCLVGMGGIGKTTLAKQVYYDKFFIDSFPIRAWITVSQSYDLQKVLKGLLDSMENDSTVKVDTLSTVGDLSERLYKRLKRWKYLIVIDDVWDTKVWDDLKRIFPDDECSSRILFTTRLNDIAVHAVHDKSCLHHVRFLNEGESWGLFCKKVFEEDLCPPQLEEIAKKIVRNCGGLPLSIVVIGGLLSRVTITQESWENVSQDLSSLIRSNGNDKCLQILSLSYDDLPNHMKKCFLYIGIFPEDSSIPVSKLVKLWVAEGFLEPLNSNRLMEDIAYETLSNLVARSLVMVVQHSPTGKIKRCEIHDLIRDFCIQEAKRETFFHITDISLYGTPLVAKTPLRLCIHPNERNIFLCDYRRLLSLEVSSLHIFDWMFYDSVDHLNCKPLRVFDLSYHNPPSDFHEGKIFPSHNIRYFSDNEMSCSTLSCSVSPELQTFILHGIFIQCSTKCPNIWNMAQLRHVKVPKLCLFDPVEGENTAAILGNLQTLSRVYNFRWSNEVLGRIPNLKKLGILYELEESDLQHYCLANLSCLQELEALTCTSEKPCPSLLQILRFPPSLRKLALEGCRIPWKEMKIVGSLPNLEVLKLRQNSFEGKEWEWESTEEEFPKLKYLLLQSLDIELWIADSVNFPSLQQLIIRWCYNLKEIPDCIGEIDTLELIELAYCRDSLIDSVNEMLQEQLKCGYNGFQLRIRGYE